MKDGNLPIAIRAEVGTVLDFDIGLENVYKDAVILFLVLLRLIHSFVQLKMIITLVSSLVVALSLFTCSVSAGDDDWLSPVYNFFFQFPLPIPPVLQPLT